MKKTFLLISLFLIYLPNFYSQIKNVEILVTKTDIEISNYLDSLFSLKQNPSYEIEKDITNNGSMIFKASFSLVDEDFYKCTSIFFVFERIKGVEFCVKQVVSGHVEYASSHLNLIKDNFVSISEGLWEKPLNEDNSIKIIAKLKRESNFFTIVYQLIIDE